MNKKLTDSEIVKALEGAYKIEPTTMFFITDYNTNKITTIGIGDIVDLINRLQAKAIKEQNKNSKLRNERNRLQAQNKDLAETVHNLTIEKDALFDKAEELKAEIERLKTNLNVELENLATEYDNKIKAEVYKEFAERIEERIAVKILKDKSNEYAEGFVDALDGVNGEIDNLLKELMGEDNETIL